MTTIFKVKGGELKICVRWAYGHRSFPDLKPNETKCIIEIQTIKDGRILKEGICRCNSADIFDKDKARKVSLTRAMENADMGRSVRTQVWHTYFNRKPKKILATAG